MSRAESKCTKPVGSYCRLHNPAKKTPEFLTEKISLLLEQGSVKVNPIFIYIDDFSAQDSFLNLLNGKEIGHRIADYVDDKMSLFLLENYGGLYEQSDDTFSKNSLKAPKRAAKKTLEGDTTGQDEKVELIPVLVANAKLRSMGDIWIPLPDGEHFAPVNIKAGVEIGQPNMVSMDKLITALETGRISEYNILYLKFDITDPKKPVYTFRYMNLLDNLDIATWDAGPGQIMLKEKDFLIKTAAQTNKFPDSLITYPAGMPDNKRDEALEHLYMMRIEGIEKLTKNRLKTADSDRIKLENMRAKKLNGNKQSE